MMLSKIGAGLQLVTHYMGKSHMLNLQAELGCIQTFVGQVGYTLGITVRENTGFPINAPRELKQFSA